MFDDEALFLVQSTVNSAIRSAQSAHRMYPLINLLLHGDTSIRAAATEAIKLAVTFWHTEPTHALLPIDIIRDAIPALLSLLQNGDVVVRRNAMEALSFLCDEKDDLAPVLLNSLRDNDAIVRANAARALGNIRADSAFPFLQDILEGTEEYLVRLEAVVALGKIADIAAVPVLINALHDTRRSIREHALIALCQFGHPSVVPALITILQESNDDSLFFHAIQALGERIDDTEVPLLISLLRTPDTARRIRIVHALGDIGHRSAVQVLIALVDDPMPPVRQAAIEALGKLGDTLAIPALQKALALPTQRHHTLIVRALGRLGDMSTLLPLINDSDFATRSEAIAALAAQGREEVIPVLLDDLNSSDSFLSARAVMSLVQLPTLKAVPGLIRALRHPEVEIRETATDILGQVGDVAAIPALIHALEFAYVGQRIRSAAALSKIKSSSAIMALVRALDNDRTVEVRIAAAQALGVLGSSDAVPALVDALYDSDPDLRQATAVALGWIGDAAAVPALLDVLPNSDGTVFDAITDTLNEIRGLLSESEEAELALDLRWKSRNETLPDAMAECNRILSSHPYGELTRGAREHVLATFGRSKNTNSEFGVDYESAGYRRRMLLYAVTVQAMLPVWERYCPDDLTPFIYFNLARAMYNGVLPRHIGYQILFLERDKDSPSKYYVGIKEDMVRTHTDAYGIDLHDRSQFVAMPPEPFPSTLDSYAVLQDRQKLMHIFVACLRFAELVLTDENLRPDEHPYAWDESTYSEWGDPAIDTADAYARLQRRYVLNEDTSSSVLGTEEPWNQDDLLEGEDVFTNSGDKNLRREFWNWWLNVAVPYAYNLVPDNTDAT